MPRLNPISVNRFVQKLKIMGFEGPFVGGKHRYMVKGQIRLTIPNPHKQEISVDLLSRLLKQANITREKWLEID
jgi:predicted RNA binding protein YcfA (HicA-like mRNA interferase family)